MSENHLEASENYWNERSESFSSDIEGQIASGKHLEFLRLIRENLPGDGKGLKILDIGCGPGFFPIILGHDGHDITAADYSEGMLKQAEANCRRHGVSATFLKRDAQNLDFADGTFDVVISRNLVWNLDDPIRAYSEWCRVLKKGGKLMLFDGNHYLYLYDKVYAADNPDYKTRHADISVDVNIMEKIAEELPLSSQRRPQWDIGALVEIGIRHIVVDVDSEKSLAVEKDGRTLRLPFDFFICTTK